MLKIATVGLGLDSVTVGASVEQSITPYLPGTIVVSVMQPIGLTGACAVQGSHDNSTWVNLHSSGVLITDDEIQFKEITLHKYMRPNVTVRSAGSVNMYLLNAG